MAVCVWARVSLLAPSDPRPECVAQGRRYVKVLRATDRIAENWDTMLNGAISVNAPSPKSSR
jgi:hypothetical protein